MSTVSRLREAGRAIYQANDALEVLRRHLNDARGHLAGLDLPEGIARARRRLELSEDLTSQLCAQMPDSVEILDMADRARNPERRETCPTA